MKQDNYTIYYQIQNQELLKDQQKAKQSFIIEIVLLLLIVIVVSLRGV
jgi:predicted nucleic acid-binding Zn ribbon protein